MKSEYLLFNSIVALGPILSLLFVPKIRKPVLVPALVAILSIAFAFIVWDIAVTGIFWTFNSAFTLGPRIGGVPFEEALFFLTVPFGCLVLWVNWGRVHNTMIERTLVPAIMLLVSTPITIGSMWVGWYYTGFISAIFILTIIFDYMSNVKLFWKRIFHSFSLLVMLLTFMFNLYLTARPVVLYNNMMKSNINILTIPIEDFVYGLVLISCVIIIYDLLMRLKINR